MPVGSLKLLLVGKFLKLHDVRIVANPDSTPVLGYQLSLHRILGSFEN